MSLLTGLGVCVLGRLFVFGAVIMIVFGCLIDALWGCVWVVWFVCLLVDRMFDLTWGLIVRRYNYVVHLLLWSCEVALCFLCFADLFDFFVIDLEC